MYYGPLKAYSPLTQPHLDTARKMPARNRRKDRKALAIFYWTARRIDGRKSARWLHYHAVVITAPAAKRRTAELLEEEASAGSFRPRWN